MSEASLHETHGTDFPVTLTEPAIQHLKETMRREGLGPEHGVRLGVTEGGCSGLSYSMGFDAERRAEDVIGEQGGVRLFVDGKSVPHLRGVTIDYVESLTSAGFRFVNPNATRTCGCGTSFS